MKSFYSDRAVTGVSHVPCVWWRLKGGQWRGAGVLHTEKGKSPAIVGAVGLGQAGGTD